jgi:hypothetical protein
MIAWMLAAAVAAAPDAHHLRPVERGDYVRVTVRGVPEPIEAAVLGVDALAMDLRQRTRDRVVAWDDVETIEVVAGRKRWPIVVGAVVGAGLGAASRPHWSFCFGLEGQREEDCAREWRGSAQQIAATLGGLVGAGLGAATSPNRWRPGARPPFVDDGSGRSIAETRAPAGGRLLSIGDRVRLSVRSADGGLSEVVGRVAALDARAVLVEQRGRRRTTVAWDDVAHADVHAGWQSPATALGAAIGLTTGAFVGLSHPIVGCQRSEYGGRALCHESASALTLGLAGTIAGAIAGAARAKEVWEPAHPRTRAPDVGLGLAPTRRGVQAALSIRF